MTNALTTKRRLLSLDVFRGITIAGMILVNNPGDWGHIYKPLAHAEWHGWTPTDLVFPFFLFIVGVSVVFALAPALEKGISKTQLTQKAVFRALKLFGLGVFMAAFPFVVFEPEFAMKDFEKLRIMGVLQRIALCYLFASLLFIYLKINLLDWLVIGCLLLYWVLMTLAPVPEYGVGMIDSPDGNFASYTDRILLGKNHLWAGASRMRDPEGLLSTMTALVNTLLGIRVGLIIRNKSLDHYQKLVQIFSQGVILVIIGYVWDWFFPINKSIWTSSYAIFTSGQAMCGLALCYYLIDVKPYKKWFFFFEVYGVNALIVFVMSGLLAKTLGLIKIAETAEKSISAGGWFYKNVCLKIFETYNASLLYALIWIALWFGVLLVMYKKNIIVKV
jgi:predicted acyltransferase